MIRTGIKKYIRKKIYNKYLNNKGSFIYWGERVFFPKNSTTFQSAIETGIYEHENLRFIECNVAENSFYFDIGANIGLLSVPLLKGFPVLNVVSVEASPVTFSYLKNTYEQSSFKNRWHLLNKAISDTEGEVDLHIADSSKGAYDSIKDTSRVEFSKVVKVQSVTIDGIWDSFNKPKVSFIKSDVEGADLLGLQGGKNCIETCKPIILIEWNRTNIIPFGYTHYDLLSFCKEINYNCYSVPYLVKIENAAELQQQTIITENFILLPIK